MGISVAIKTANNNALNTFKSKPLFDNSYPPCKPIAINKYKENSFGKGCGIDKSDFKKTASIPKKKNRIGGFKIFCNIISIFILVKSLNSLICNNYSLSLKLNILAN